MNRMAIAAVGLVLTAGSANGQDYPSRPIRVVVPYGPGTGVDVAARLMTVQLARVLGQSVIVENRPGAAASVGTNLVANSPPDGYTLLAHASSITSVPAYQINPTYRVSDLRGLSIFADMTYVLVTSAATGIKSVLQLVEAAKQKPDSMTFASAGVGTGTYIGAAKLNMAEGLIVRHVPYKSTTDALTDVIAGRVDFGYTQITSALGHIQAGRITPLAVSAARSSALPEVPSVTEVVKEAGYSLWIGLLAPAKTPQPVVDVLGAAIAKVRDSEEFQKALTQTGGEVVKTTPAQMDAILLNEIAENEAIVKRLKIEKQ